MGMFNECIKPFDHPRSVGFSSAGRLHGHLQHRSGPRPWARPVLPRPLGARPGLLARLALPLLPAQACARFRLSKKWLRESRLAQVTWGGPRGRRRRRGRTAPSGGDSGRGPGSRAACGARRWGRGCLGLWWGSKGDAAERKSLLKERICVWNKVMHLLAFCCTASIYQTRRIRFTYIFSNAASAQVQRHPELGGSQ
ncbi:unnamed protein product [Nyctereutes procyonoides]|uniref:(raccoon dog) hypothetical protein n=1 Tax=Nyctereutes procyonoides TaxID=34880 RepID=A0A811ZSH9_NYCPR|nr:unnamed protein product [Nyctereutes procyonoides]